jgi:hypothetical protein
MMNMNGGFKVSDYDTEISNVSEAIQDMVREFDCAVGTFRENYKKGTPGAKAAYYTLSAFTIDELDNKSLADYFVYSQVPDGFYLKLLMNAHMDILSSILSALTMAVQGETGNTWLDRLAKIEDPYNVTNSLYWDQAVALLPHFESFFTTYDSIDHELFRGPGSPLYNPPDDEGNKGEEIGEDGGEVELNLFFDPDRFMGDYYMEEDEPFIPIMTVKLKNEGISFEDDVDLIYEVYGARVISYEYDEPIVNSFNLPKF